MKQKRLISLFLSISIILAGLSSVAFAESENVLYIDETIQEKVQYLQRLGIFNLYTDSLFFEEETAVKRHEAAKALVDYLGYSENAYPDITDEYYDVPDYYEHKASVAAAVGNGLMKGYGNGLFGPEEEMIAAHFVKALITSFGYEKKADAMGGYPNGYRRIADELDLLNGISLNLDGALTRGQLVNILYAALDAPIAVVTGVSPDSVSLEINKDVTVLSHFHNLHRKTDYVYSNDMISLKSGFEANEETILIGNNELFVGDNSEVFDYLGYQVEYFYKQNENTERLTLVMFHTVNDGNEYVVKLMPRDISNISSSSVTVLNEKQREKTYKISSAARFYYNGGQITSDLQDELSGFNGSLTLIDTKQNGTYDTVMIFDYVYDEVVTNDERTDAIYCRTKNITLTDTEVTKLIRTDGMHVPAKEILSGMILGIAESKDGKFVTAVVLDRRLAISITEKNDTYVYDADGNEYLISSSLTDAQKSLLELGQYVTITLNDQNEIIWVTRNTGANLAYLIKTEMSTESGLSEPKVRITLLHTSGDVKKYVCEDGLRIDGRKIETENIASNLASTKTQLSLISDGETSQVVQYKLDDNGNLVELGTAAPGTGTLTQKFNATEGGVAVWEYSGGAGSLAHKHALTNTVPIFRVPKTNQEILEEEFYGVVYFKKDGGPERADSVEMEGYVNDAETILSDVFVMYQTEAASIPRDARMFMVESVRQVLDATGDEADMLCGWYQDGYKKFILDVSSMPTLTAGDIVIFRQDNAQVVREIKQIYDRETDSILPGYEIAGDARGREIHNLTVYNAPAGSLFYEAYPNTGANGTVNLAPDGKRLLSTLALTGKSGVFTFDKKTEKITQGWPVSLLDYKCSGTNAARVIARFSYDYMMEIFIYQ